MIEHINRLSSPPRGSRRDETKFYLDRRLQHETIDGRFRILDPIGQGGMGTVWRAEHVGTSERFAIKVLRSSGTQHRKLVRRVLHEATVTAAVQSPHVVRVIEVNAAYQHNGEQLPYIVMELLEGCNFSDYIEQEGSIESEQLVWVMSQVAAGLHAAHGSGITHRDLKPANIFLARGTPGGNCVVKLCDFGIAKLQDHNRRKMAETGTYSTEAGAVLGTPRYMAPEQLRRHGQVTPATDQWAFGQIAYRALANKNYFDQARNGAELILAIVHEPMPTPSALSERIPSAFDSWFLRSCARDPDLRFPDILDQQRHLEICLGAPSPRRVVLAEQPKDCGQFTPWEFGDSNGQTKQHDEPVAEAVRSGSERATRLDSTAKAAVVVAALASAVVGARYTAGTIAEKYTSMSLTVHSARTARTTPVPTPERTVPNLASSVITALALVDADRTRAPDQRSTATRTISTNKVTRKPEMVNTAKLLPRGASCTRSAQCADGICAAEVCQ